jgi:hypothetical protein
MDNLETRVQKIEERNRGVEEDKAWETSASRRLLLAAFSYLAVALFFVIIAVPNPWLNALVPALAFMIQQLSMPYFKKLWLKIKK